MPTDDEIIARFSHWDPKNKRVAHGLGIVIASFLAIPTMFAAIWILMNAGYSPYRVLPFSLLAIPVMFLHEFVHATFQWVFSKEKPLLGFKFPFAFSKLRPNTSISRNEAILSALSPCVLITSVLMAVAFFTTPLIQVALIIVIYLHASTCGGDFHLTHWLLKYPSNTRLGIEDTDIVMFSVPVKT
jgi:hypothetical protein